MIEMEDHYLALGIPRNATAEEIERAYQRQVEPLRAFRNWGRRRRENALIAYQTLSDPAKRAAYDARLEGESPKS